MRGAAATLRHELIGLSGVLERNAYLVKRYVWWELAFFVWSLANTLTIVFIAKGIHAAGGKLDVDRATTTLLIGAVIWSYLGIVFEIMTETVAWERWEGTIEYTFMAPLSRSVHLIGMGLFAIAYGLVRAALVFGAISAFFGLHMPEANFGTALLLLGVGLARHLAAARDRRRLDSARTVGVPARRAVRQEAREAEAVGMSIVARAYDELAPRFGEWAAGVEDDPWVSFVERLEAALPE